MRLILADARPSLTDASGTCAYSILPIHPRHPGTGFCLHLLPGSDLTYALLVARRAIQNLWAAYRIASGWPTTRERTYLCTLGRLSVPIHNCLYFRIARAPGRNSVIAQSLHR